MKRPLVIGALVSAVIALFTSAAVAGGALGEPSSGWPSGPLMTSGYGHVQSADMMGGNSRGQSADMMGDYGQHPSASMLGGRGNER